MRKAKFPSVYTGNSWYRRGDYPANIHRKYIPTAAVIQQETRLKLVTEVLTTSASGTENTYALQNMPERSDNVFVFLNGVRQEIGSFSVVGQNIVFAENVPAEWSIIVTYSKL